MSVIPIFYDHSSKKSLLTYDPIKDVKAGGPASIVKLCKDHDIQRCYGVSDKFDTFIDAWKNLRKEKMKFRFGLEMWMCDDSHVRDANSLFNEHKIIIFAKNSAAYKDLIKIFSTCRMTRDNFYYKYRFDFKQLNPLWTDNLTLALPFFDSAIARNTIGYNANIIPDFPTAPVIVREQNTEHPQADVINDALDNFNRDGKFEEVKTKTIFYERADDMDAYTVYRCIHNRGASFDEPKMDYFCSPSFSFENYLALK